MDTVDCLTHTITEADRQADLFGVNPAQLADSLRDINRLDTQGRQAYAANTVLGAVINVATVHRQDCDRYGCATCAAISEAFAANLATLRVLRLDAVERRRHSTAQVD